MGQLHHTCSKQSRFCKILVAAAASKGTGRQTIAVAGGFSIVVAARDTDVLVLLLANFANMPCQRIWMKTGTFNKPIHLVAAQFDVHVFTPNLHFLTLNFKPLTP